MFAMAGLVNGVGPRPRTCTGPTFWLVGGAPQTLASMHMAGSGQRGSQNGANVFNSAQSPALSMAIRNFVGMVGPSLTAPVNWVKAGFVSMAGTSSMAKVPTMALGSWTAMCDPSAVTAASAVT